MIKTFSMTDVGMKRKVNQDYVFTQEKPLGNLPNLFVVADGMGGHNAGDYASKMAVETIVDVAEASFEKNPVKILEKAIEAANSKILSTAAKHEELEGMGTTVVAATCFDRYLHIANVGDSRLYIVNNESIKQITRDHSLVAEMVRMGGLLSEEAKNHPKKNIITRAVGAAPEVEPEFFTVELEEGDIVLMCTDGLTNMLEDEEIRVILESGRDMVESTESLVEAANKNGGNDNISVVLINPFAK